MAGVDPSVKRKEVDELVADGRKLLAVAVRKLLAKIESGDATAADFNSAARLCDLLDLDCLLDMRDGAADEIRRTLEELDSEEEERIKREASLASQATAHAPVSAERELFALLAQAARSGHSPGFDELTAILSSRIGREVGFEELRALVEDVNRARRVPSRWEIEGTGSGMRMVLRGPANVRGMLAPLPPGSER
jgi:hypothetical protein